MDGRAICCFVHTDGSLVVSTARDLKVHLTQGKGGTWEAGYQLAPRASDCNCAIHPGKAKGQIWYTKLDGSNNPSSVYTTSTSTGTNNDWAAPTTIPTPAYPYSYTLSTLTQPNSPYYNGSTWQYVVSQSLGKGADAARAGKDTRLCWYPSEAYNVPGVIGNALVSKDDGQGDKWEWRDLTGSGAYNSYDGAPPALAPESLATYLGKAYTQTIAPNVYPAPSFVLAKSAMVKADDDSLYQLIFATKYSRRAQLAPRADTDTAQPGHNRWLNNTNNQAPSSTTQTNNYTLDVPAGSDTIQYVRLNWQFQARERANVAGTLDNANRPTKLRFDIPALQDIPPYNDLSHPDSPYGGSSYLYASIVLDVVYINAKGLQIAFTHNLTQGSSGQQYPPAQQAKTPMLNGRGEYAGSATWDYYGNFDIDRSRDSTIIFDVLVTGQYDSITFKSATLHIHNLQCEHVDNLSMASAQTGSTAPTVAGLLGNPPEFYVHAAYPVSGQSLSAPTNQAILDEINSARGAEWQFDLTWTQATNSFGPSGSNKALPIDDLMVDQYAQCLYQANQSDATKGDFYLYRSRDGGLTWEIAGDGKTIAQLGSLRDWNNTEGADIKMPSLLTGDNIIYAVWVESAAVQMVASQDAGETWVSA